MVAQRGSSSDGWRTWHSVPHRLPSAAATTAATTEVTAALWQAGAVRLAQRQVLVDHHDAHTHAVHSARRMTTALSAWANLHASCC